MGQNEVEVGAGSLEGQRDLNEVESRLTLHTMPSTERVNHLAVITGVILLLWHIRSQSILTLIFDVITPRVTNITSAILLAIFYCYSCSTISETHTFLTPPSVNNSKIVYIAVGTNPPSVAKHE